MIDEHTFKDIEKYGYCKTQEGFNLNEKLKKNNYCWSKWNICDLNKFQETIFYTKENTFLHFTSIEALNLIINSGKIRLYNLNNMDDKFEIEYAKKELSFKNLNDNYKENVFALSMCSSKQLSENLAQKHLMWKLYGKDGGGVAIKLKLSNEMLNWEAFSIIKIIYGVSEFTDLKEFNLKQQNNHLDNLICSFIKSPIYEFENEIRLLFNSEESTSIERVNKKIFPTIYRDKLENQKVIKYLELPLLKFSSDENEVFKYYNTNQEFKEIPFLEIEEIVLGYRFDKEDLENFKKNVNTLPINPDKIKLSELKEYY